MAETSTFPPYEGEPWIDEVRCIAAEGGDWNCNVFTGHARENVFVDEVRAHGDAKVDRDGTRIHITPDGESMTCGEVYEQDGRFYYDLTKLEPEDFDTILLCE